MAISSRGLDFVVRHEGFVSKAYRDQGGVWTIGTGFTNRSATAARMLGPIGAGKTITRAQNDRVLLEAFALEYGPPVDRAMTGGRQHELDCGYSCCFNAGAAIMAAVGTFDLAVAAGLRPFLLADLVKVLLAVVVAVRERERLEHQRALRLLQRDLRRADRRPCRLRALPHRTVLDARQGLPRPHRLTLIVQDLGLDARDAGVTGCQPMGARAQHGGAADIDIFDALLEARAFSDGAALPYAEHALHRSRFTTPQVGLTAVERLVNVQDAFSADDWVQGRHVLLIDDVCTTGATMANFVGLAAGRDHVHHDATV
mgnify:CR=1 FL=1